SGQTTGPSSVQNTANASDDGDSGAPGSAAPSASSGGGASTDGASLDAAPRGEGGLLTTDGAAQNDPDVDYSVAPVTLTMTPFDVAGGDEVYYCQNFANPWGKGVDIKIYSL